MLLLTDSDYLTRKARYDDLIQEAQRANLLKTVEAQSPPAKARFLYSLGSRLIAWGQRLQQYGATQPRKLA